jgi:thiol-disulfide isomerase/thioredoxin
MIEDVSDENYESFTKATAAVVVYGLATCEPCKAYDPILVDVAERFPHVRFGKAKMHVPGRCRAIKKLHHFETYPTTHVYANGDLLCTKEGKLESSELSALLEQYFSPAN